MLLAFLAIWSSRLLAMTRAFQWLPALAARICVGWVFVESGWGKWHHLDKVAAYFTDLGLPFPIFQAYLVSGMELACGLCLLVGFCTRLATLPLMTIMAVAILTAKKEDFHGFSDLIGFPEFLYLLLLFWLLIQGAGFVAVDTWLARVMKRRG